MKKLVVFIVFLCLSNLLIGQVKDGIIEAFKKSYELEQFKEYEKAIKELDAVYNPSSYELNLRLGWLNYLNGDFPKSVVFYKKAGKIASRSVEPKLGLIYPLSALGNQDLIISTYQSILHLDPGNSTANYQLAELFFLKKKFSEAEKYLDKVLQLYPFSYNSLILMAKVKVSLGKVVDAKDMYYKASLYNPSDQNGQRRFKEFKIKQQGLNLLFF